MSNHIYTATQESIKDFIFQIPPCPSQSAIDEILSDLAFAIKAERKKRNLSQVELANKVGISRRTLTSIESGSGGSFETYLKLTMILGISLDGEAKEIRNIHAVADQLGELKSHVDRLDDVIRTTIDIPK